MAVRYVDFTWHAGLSASQKKKSVRALHDAAKSALKADRVLEISTKSEDPIGVALSAFNLKFTTKRNKITLSVESAFQGSKVLNTGGPYTDLYLEDSKTAKIDKRIRNGGELLYFMFFGQKWPKKPVTAFYDWIYLNALSSNKELSDHLENFSAFTDIEFNPEKSLNCQAYSVALYMTLRKNDLLQDALSSPESFLEIVGKIPGYGITSSRALDL